MQDDVLHVSTLVGAEAVVWFRAKLLLSRLWKPTCKKHQNLRDVISPSFSTK